MLRVNFCPTIGIMKTVKTRHLDSGTSKQKSERFDVFSGWKQSKHLSLCRRRVTRPLFEISMIDSIALNDKL